ncbi:MAG: MCE family protein [Sphingomonadales bacterium]|nr:MCE family protein [Sphingomonadales bacterium]
MKISNETKVGALTILALALLFIGFNYLKGRDVFSRSKKIYAVFTDLGSLEKSNEVKINGLPIGSVYDKREKDKDVSAIVVTIQLTRDINIPKNSVAYISSSLVGSSYIVIERGNSSELLQDEDTIATRLETGILGDVKAQLDPTISSVRNILDSLKKTLGGINQLLDTENRNNLKQTMANLNTASANLNMLLNSESGALARSLQNAEDFTGTLKASSQDIKATLQNTKRVSEQLAAMPLAATVDSLEQLIGSLRSTLQSINQGKGTLGGLLQDRTLYDQLQQTVLSAEILMDDLRTHPKRYVQVSVFGKKDKSTPLSSPAKKTPLSDPAHDKQ